MKSTITFIRVILLWTVIGVLTKLLFLVAYSGIAGNVGVTDWLKVMWYGLRLDIAVAGYLSAVPVIILLFNVWNENYPIFIKKTLSYIWHGYFAITAFLTSICFCVNIGLYGYWGFPLDNTPLLYLRTSPSDAMASMTVWEMTGGILGITILTIAIFRVFWCYAKLYDESATSKHSSFVYKIMDAVVTLLLAATMIIPIRGGIGTGTNHTGSVYFTTDMVLNHAAVNPLFSFVESLENHDDIPNQFRFMDDKEATSLFLPMTYTTQRTDTVDVLEGKVQNVVIIMLESFSKYIMTESGHVKDVTPNLDRLSKEGLYFTNFYANSFRTDRAMVSILSGLPAQPTMSIMDYPHKCISLPSIARSLDREGWGTAFYYGGDMKYSDMQNYYVGTGFQTIISDKDFPEKLQTGKWGVADGPVFDRIFNDIKSQQESNPSQKQLRVVMTESSHEPFDVPNYRKLNSPELNAFSYADSCLGKFISELKSLPSWKNTLVVILPDHLGSYPEHIDNCAFWRYESPLIMVGGAVKEPRRISTISCQTDLPATLLAMLGYKHQDFLYSKDIFDSKAPHFAFFTNDYLFGIITNDSKVIFDNPSQSIIKAEGENINNAVMAGKAYLQKLYDDIAQR